MEPIYMLAPLITLSFLLGEKSKKSYENIYSALVSVIACGVCSVSCIVAELIGFYNPVFNMVIGVLPSLAAIICKLVIRKISKSDGYFIPYRYTNGKLVKLLEIFYERHYTVFFLKNKYVFVRNMLLIAGVLGFLFGVWQTINTNQTPSSFPVALCSLIIAFFEIAFFLCGKTRLAKAEENYKIISKRDNARDYMKAGYEFPDDYEYLFRKVNATEKPHLLYSTIHNYAESQDGTESIKLYDFEEKRYTNFIDYEQNDILNEFLKSNGLKVNNLYVQVFTLLNKGNNVLMKASSYTDFDPYLAALIKIKSAETYKTIVVVDSNDSGNGFINRYRRIFKEYFGISAIPVIRKFKDAIAVDYDQEIPKTSKSGGIDTLFGDIFNEETENIISSDKVKTDVIVVTPEDILDSENTDALRKFASDINFIIYYDFSECVHEETLMCKIVHSVLDSNDKISTLYMTDGFFDFKQAINNFFSVRPFYEVIVPRKYPQKSYCTVWKYEYAGEIQERAITNPSVDFGMHPVLAVYGMNHLNNNCMLIADENDIYAETFSEFGSLSSTISKVDCFVGWKDLIDGNYVYCSVTDRYNNIPHTYLALRGLGIQSEYINIISKPYLLREYLAYFSKFFSMEPDALTSFSAAMINTSRALALECIVKCFLVGCTESQIKNYAVKLRLDHTKRLELLLKDILNETGLIDTEIELNTEYHNGLYFVSKEIYDEIIDKTEFVKKVFFSVNNQQIVRYQKDFRYLVPRQKIVLDGKKYTVLKINGNHIELSDSQAREAVYSTRIIRSCHAYKAKKQSTVQYISHNNSSSMQMTNIICDLDVNIHGRISFKDSYSFDESKQTNNYMYTKASSVFVRKYKDANILRVKFKFPEDITSENRNSMAHTMALLINEMLPTFFPRHSERIVLACSGWNGEIPLEAEKVNLDYIVSLFKSDDEEACCDDEFCIYMFEDSEIETGVVNVFWQDEEIRYMFKILEDYLYFLEVVDRDTKNRIFGENTERPLHELRKALLHLVDHPLENGMTEYANSIRRTRDTFNEKRLINTYAMVCDFCGKPIKNNGSNNSYKFYHYAGKQSCPQCASTAVTTEDIGQVALCESIVKEWISDSYGAAITGPSFNSLEDAEFINKQANPDEYYATTDDRDYGTIAYTSLCSTQADVSLFPDEELMLRVVSGTSGERALSKSSDCEDSVRSGYFTDNANVILIENGLPRFRHESVQAHELTHQWQYEKLSTELVYAEPCPLTIRNDFGQNEDLTQFKLEGQSSWVEWCYLRKHGHFKEAAKLKRSLMNSNNVYGVGFRWFRNLIRIGGTDKYSRIRRSFSFKLKRLKYQILKNPYGLMMLYFGE